RDYSKMHERTQKQTTLMSLLVLRRWILRLIPRSVRRLRLALHPTAEWREPWLHRKMARHNTNMLRAMRATTGQLIMPMALISSRLGNYRHTRICILFRLILDRGVPLRIRTPKWRDIIQPVHRTFWVTRYPAR